MVQRQQGIVAMVASIVALYLLGCGGAANEPPKAVSRARPAPYGESGDVSDLRGPDDLARSDAGGEKIDPKDLKVPGAQYGMKKAAGAQKKCPKGKKGKKCRKARKKSRRIPFSNDIAGQMEGLPWGMHYKAVVTYFENAVRRGYKEKLAKAKGAVEEDRVRSKMLRELAKIRKSYVKFDGQRTGFEGAMIEKEFTHNNQESMFTWDAGKFVEFMFFFEGRFWKRVRTFRRDSFKADIRFDDYVQTLINRFGPGLEVFSENGELEEIKWQDKTTYMSAGDKSGFYGVYVLVFAARVSEDNVARLRPNKGRDTDQPGANTSSLVESVLGGEQNDHNTSVIDSYTGGGSPGGNASARKKQSESEYEDSEDSTNSTESAPAQKDTSVDDLF